MSDDQALLPGVEVKGVDYHRERERLQAELTDLDHGYKIMARQHAAKRKRLETEIRDLTRLILATGEV